MKINKKIQKLIINNFELKKKENILIITDSKLQKIGKLFFECKSLFENEFFFLTFKPRKEHGEEPPEFIKRSMKNADIILIPTSKSLSHTKARIEASKKGARIASMPGITLPILRRMLNVDYLSMKKLTEKIAEKLKHSSKVRIKTDIGTDLVMNIENRIVHKDYGIIKDKGDFGNLPAGEADLSPKESSCNGKLYIDGSVLMKKIKEPIKVQIKDGYARKFTGGPLAKKLKSTLDSYGKKAFNIAELGIGTNRQAIITGNILEDEKVYGTCHIAFGNNKSYGGKIDVPIHLDAVIKNPTIICDNQTILKKGQSVI